MATIGYAELPIPGGGDAPQWPGALAALAEAIDPHLWQHATNAADRDTRFATAPLHTVVTATSGAVWIKTSGTSNVWATIYEPLTAWVPLPLASGVQAAGAAPVEYRVVGTQVWVRGRVEKSSGTWTGSSGTVIAPVPAEAVPARICTWAGGQSLAGDPLTGVCRIEVSATAFTWWSEDGTGTTWVDLSGSYWLD